MICSPNFTGASEQIILQGRSPSHIVRSRKNKNRKHVKVILTGAELLLFWERKLNMPGSKRRPFITISFSNCKKVSATRYGNACCLLTVIRAVEDGGAITIPVIQCQFFEAGIKSPSHSRRGLPTQLNIYYNEPSVGCLICRMQQKIGQVIEPHDTKDSRRRQHKCPAMYGPQGRIQQPPNFHSSGSPSSYYHKSSTYGAKELEEESQGEGGQMKMKTVEQLVVEKKAEDGRRAAEAARSALLRGVTAVVQKECAICLTDAPTILFTKCGHLCCCKPCLRTYLTSVSIDCDDFNDDELDTITGTKEWQSAQMRTWGNQRGLDYWT